MISVLMNLFIKILKLSLKSIIHIDSIIMYMYISNIGGFLKDHIIVTHYVDILILFTS